jgi:para-aminobenzoate synthetase component 1
MNALGRKREPFYFMVSFEKSPTTICLPEDMPAHGLMVDFPNIKTPYSVENHDPVYLDRFPMDYQEYALMFRGVMEEIEYGNSFLLNLTCATPIRTGHDLLSIFRKSEAKYKIHQEGQFVCFSPEPFVRIKDDIIVTYPMKGTIDLRIKNARDTLMNDSKELAEHYTIVDLLRNDLASVAKDVEVNKFRYLEEVLTGKGRILQTSSQISASLDKNWPDRFGDIFDKLLPAGSVSGAPKEKTVEIIEQVEKDKRGYYTGVAGYFDGSELDSCVMIRFIEKRDGKLYYRSGGGITGMSDCRSEYYEMIKKIYVPVI